MNSTQETQELLTKNDSVDQEQKRFLGKLRKDGVLSIDKELIEALNLKTNQTIAFVVVDVFR